MFFFSSAWTYKHILVFSWEGGLLKFYKMPSLVYTHLDLLDDGDTNLDKLVLKYYGWNFKSWMVQVWAWPPYFCRAFWSFSQDWSTSLCQLFKCQNQASDLRSYRWQLIKRHFSLSFALGYNLQMLIDENVQIHVELKVQQPGFGSNHIKTFKSCPSRWATAFLPMPI